VTFIATLAIGSVLVFVLLWRVDVLRRRTRFDVRERELGELADARRRALVDHASDTILTVDALGTIESANAVADRMLGRDAGSLPGRKLAELVHREDLSQVATLIADAMERPGESSAAEWRIVRPDGSELHVEALGTSLLDHPEVEAIVVVLRDVSERRAFEEQLRHDAFHDPLTQLPNHALFCDRVEHALAREQRKSRPVAVLSIDLDDFKDINDAFGHAAGDELLVDVAGRLRGGLRSGDTPARLSGDGFAVLLEDVHTPDEVKRAAARVLELLYEPFVVHAEPTPLQASIGIAIAPEAGGTAQELLRNADFAMYTAKHNGKGCFEVFDPVVQEKLLRKIRPGGPDEDEPDRAQWFMRKDGQRREVQALLDREDSITPVFQPIVDLRTGAVAGYEALARFPGPTPRPPNVWFAQAHLCGLGNELEALALRAALGVEGRPEGTYLCVNLSQSALLAPETAAALPQDLSVIVIEVTENELVAEGVRLQAALARLRARGARVAVDDMGAGYAGLKQLMRLRPDMIKLDRSLIDGVHSDEAKGALIDSMVRYARKIAATVCAEGIETQEDLEVLADLDVSHGQGYCLARPAPPWTGVDPAAVETCLRSFRAVMDHASPVGGGSESGELRLELLMRRVSRASWLSDVGDVMESLATELHGDEVALSALRGDATSLETVARHGWWPLGEHFVLADFPATAGAVASGAALQVLVSDPDADDAEVELMVSRGLGSLLMVPVTHAGRTIGLLEAYSFEERPWTRTEIHRARIVSYQLGAVLESFAREGDQTMRRLVHRSDFSATGIDEFRRRRNAAAIAPSEQRKP
jgi:diguanylate cyclase (GGDEF)-like protein/PAS domain S-box-containing protein